MTKILHERINGCIDCPYCVNIDGWENSWCEHPDGDDTPFAELAFNLPDNWIAEHCPLPEGK